MREEERRLTEIEQEIAENHYLITPEQEAEIDALTRESAIYAGNLVAHFKLKHDKLKKLVDEAKKLLAHFKNREDSYRPRMTSALKKNWENGGSKNVSAEDGLWSAVLVQAGKGRVEVTGPVPPEYCKEETVLKPDTELIRALLESAGDQPWAKLVKEPHVRITINEDLMLEREIRKELT